MKRHSTRYAGVTYRLTTSGQRRYSIDYTDSNNKRVWKTVDGNERDALAALRDVKTRMHRGERVVNSKLTLSELANDYFRSQGFKNLKPSTRTTYEEAFKFWVEPKLGRRKATSLDVATIADFVAEMNQSHSGGTVRTALSPMSGMFRLAVRRGWMNLNPISQLDRQERPKSAPKRMRILDTEEIQSLLAVRHHGRSSVYRPLFMVAIFAGLRRGELLALRWEDVNLAEGILRVAPEGHGKTAAATREVVLPKFLVQELARQDALEGLVFPFQKRNVNRALYNALEKAKIEHVRFHDLRHTFASILIGQGEDVVYVADQMGHASPATTLKIYAKLFDARKKKDAARERMQESFEGIVG